MLLKHQSILQILTIFFLYANNPTKSRREERQEKRADLQTASTYSSVNTLQLSCPAIPKCHWIRFEELKLKVQQGAQSSVTLLMDHFNREPVIKKIFSDKIDFANEVKALSCLRVGHNPLLVYPLCVDPLKMAMVLEWGGEGDLTRWDLFRDEAVKYSYADVVRISAQIVAAVAASHRRGFLHGDIKPENFVINLKQKASKLIDFGLSARIGDYRIMNQGTPQTMAPEVAFPDFFRSRIRLGPNAVPKSQKSPSSSSFLEKPQIIKEAMDWWSVGVTIHYLFSKYYDDETETDRESDSEHDSEHDRENESESDSDSSYSSKSKFRKRSKLFKSEREPSLVIEGANSGSDDHYFPYKIIWTDDGRDILNFQHRPIPVEFSPALKGILAKLMAWNPERRNFDRKRVERELLRDEFFDTIDWNEVDPNLPK